MKFSWRSILAAGVGCWLAVSLMLLVFCRHCSEREFENPVAYTVIADRLFVLEKKDNRLLELSYVGPDKPLRLIASLPIEVDDDHYFYMVREIYPGLNGELVAQSYMYDHKTREFVGYCFRGYDAQKRRPPREILRITFSEPTRYPEMRYAHDGRACHYFVNTCAGERNLWKLPDVAAGVVLRDHPNEKMIALGDTNSEWASWNSIQVAADGRIFLSGSPDGKLIEYAPDGRRAREFGAVGVGGAQLLAPDWLTFTALTPSAPPLLTVASTGNRCWLQFDAFGRRVRALEPLAMNYPFADILVGALCQHPQLGICAFDLVNRCLVVPGPPLRVVRKYRAGFGAVLTLAFARSFLAVIVLFVAWGLVHLAARLRFPLFVKLTALFVPLMLAGNLAVEQQVRRIMRADKEEEMVLRMANLAQAVLNNVALDDLLAIKAPADRESPAYERIYLTVSRIVDARSVPNTPKWIIHKVVNNRFYFGINIWRGPIFEPFIVTPDRDVFLRAVAEKTSQFGRFQDDQGEWFSYIRPIMDAAGKVIYLLELYRPTEVIDRAEHAAARRARLIVYATGGLLLVVIVLFSYGFLRPLRRLMHATERISAGDFVHRIPLVTRDEWSKLGAAFNQMAARLADFTEAQAAAAAEKERIQAELRFAHDMQSGLLPTVFPPCPGMENAEIAARLQPAREIGGDYFDFFLVDDAHLGVVIADVAGKGVPAGLFLMEFRTLLRSIAHHCCEAASVLREVNARLAADNPSVMFVTVFYLVVNLRTGRGVFCNAGHPPPFLYAHGVWRPFGNAQHAMALGVDSNAVYEDEPFVLGSDNILLLYTDGVTEAPDRVDRMFGTDGLLRLLPPAPPETLSEMVEKIVRAVMAHQTGREQFDDITLLALRCKPSAQAANGITG